MQYIISIGIFQALVAAGLLWKNKLRSSADSLLILLVCCIGTHLGIKFIIYNFVNDQEVRYQMNTFIGCCYVPLLYLYTSKIKSPEFLPATRWYVFLPFVLCAIAYFTVAGVLFVAGNNAYPMLHVYNKVSFWLMIVLDLALVFRILASSRNGFPEGREKQLIIRLARSFLLITFLSILYYGITLWRPPAETFFFRSSIYALLAGLCVMIIRYRYVATSPIPATAPLSLTETETVGVPQVPETAAVPCVADAVIQQAQEEQAARRTTLTAPAQAAIWLSLEAQLKQERIFADSDLNLDKLAQATGISKYHISETLNHYAQKSFYQYINEYRISFALDQMQRLCERSLPVNMLSLAYDAGFKAKSSFNRYFKEITGVTPTEHLRSLQQTGSLTAGPVSSIG